MNAMLAPRRTNSFERSSQRRQQHDVEGRANVHLAAAQVNHKERCGSDLQNAESLKLIVKNAMAFEPSAVRVALKDTCPPDLELLALLEGKLDSPSRVLHPAESQSRLQEQLEAAGLQLAVGAPTNGSLLEALSHSGEISQQNIADWMEANEGASFNRVPLVNYVSWGRLTDALSSPDWKALVACLRDRESFDPVGADWLLLVAATQLLHCKLLVYSSTFNVAVRFVPQDEQHGFQPSARLPPGADWIRLVLLDGHNFQCLEPKPLPADGLVQRLDEVKKKMEAQVQSRAGLPAVMLLGLTGVGKSSLLHALSGKQMYEVDDGTRKSVKVLPEDIILGSRIGDTANSTTKLANAITIGEGSQQWLLIDTPGFDDTEGHTDNILNAVSTARTMQLCSSLRIVMLIKQADVTDEKLGAFVELGKTISKLFTDFSTASMSLAVWVVKPTEKIKEKRMEKMLKKAFEQKTCQEAQRLLELVIKQLDRQHLRVIRYTKEGGGEGSDSDEDSDDDASDDGVVVGAEEDRWKKVTFPTQELLGQLQGMVALEDPMSHCLLPLSADSSEHLRRLAREVRDRCETAAELPDFAQMQHDLMVLKRISEHFKEVEQGTAGAGLADQVKTARKTVHGEYVHATIKAKARVEEQLNMRVDALRGALSEGGMNSPLDSSVLDGFCWAIRCMASAVEVESHIKGLPTTETLQRQFAQLLTSLCEKAHALAISDTAVHATLLKLTQMKDYFGGPLCAKFIENDIEFGAVGQVVQSCGDGLANGIVAQMAGLHTEVLLQLKEGIAAASRAPDIGARPSAFYDKAALQLRTMREAQQRLIKLVPQLASSYENAIQAIGESLQRLSEWVREIAEAGGAAQLKQLRAHLMALLEACSTFGLREHFDLHHATGSTNRLDELYEQCVESVVMWHKLVTVPVQEDTQVDGFVERIGSHRARLETAKQLFKLGTDPASGLADKLSQDIQGRCAERQKHVEMLIHKELGLFAREAEDNVKDLDNAKSTYDTHRKRVSLLEAAAWWDALGEEDTIGKALDVIWYAFEQRLRRLANGPDSVESKLRAGMHKVAAESLVRVHEMAPLWSHAATGGHSHGKASELKQLYDACVTSVREWIAKRCQLAQTELLADQWSASVPPRVDKVVWDVLKKADRFLELTTHLRGEELEEVLDLSELSRLGSHCASRVQTEFEHMRRRVLKLADAIAMTPPSGADKLVKALQASPPDDLKDVMRVFSCPNLLPNVYASFESSDDFHHQYFQVIELSFTNNLKQANQRFSRLRLDDQKVLTQALTDIERALPPSDSTFAALKKDFAFRQEAMAERFASSIDKNRSIVIEEFLRNSYTMNTYRKMADLQKLGRDENGEGEPSEEFTDACHDLAKSICQLIKNFEDGALILTLTMPSSLATAFDTNERLSAPWNSLQAALSTGHDAFLDPKHLQTSALPSGQSSQASSGVSGNGESGESTVVAPLGLRAKMQVLLKILEDATGRALEKHQEQFCHNELLTGAISIEQVAAVVESLRTSQELYEMAQRALTSVRDAQAKHLEGLLMEPVMRIGDRPTKRQRRDDDQEQRREDERNLKAWLQAQARLLSELDQLQRTQSPMRAKYCETFLALVARIDDVVRKQFEPVLNNSGWRELDKAKVEQIDCEFHAFTSWHNKQPTAVTEQLTVDDEELRLAQERIEVRRRTFLVTNFEAKEPVEQAEIINAHRMCPREYSDFIEKYRIGYTQAHETVSELLRKFPNEHSPAKLTEVMVRLRQYVQHDLFEGTAPPDLQPYRSCEERLLTSSNECFTTMQTHLTMGQEERSQHTPQMEQQLDEQLKVFLQGSIALVQTAAHGVKCEPSSAMLPLAKETFEAAKAQALQVVAMGGLLLEKLIGEIRSLHKKVSKPPECPAEIAGIGVALRRLQVWEGIPGSPDSILPLAVRLEKALPAPPERPSSSSGPPSPSCSAALCAEELHKLLGTHHQRVNNVCVVLCNVLDQIAAQLNAEYDPEKDPPLQKERFELALCKEMDMLVNECSWKVGEIRAKRDALRSTVLSVATQFRANFNAMLAGKKFEEAGKALKSLKRYELLMEMEQFASCRAKASDYRQELDMFADKLYREAEDVLASATKCDDMVWHLLHLKKLEDKIPSATTAARTNIKKLLSLTQKKWPQGMQMLAASLRSLDPVLGNAIINSSESFTAVRVMIFNQRTQQDFDDVLDKLAGEPSLRKVQLKAQYEEFEMQYSQDVEDAIKSFNFGNDPIFQLAQRAGDRAKPPSSRGSSSNFRADFMSFIGIGAEVQHQVPKVLAAVFALWTVSFYLRTHDPNSSADEIALRKPHAVQVLCILRLLGVVKTGKLSLENHLAEVPTGEGKSVVLAVSAAALALYGYYVDCVCYSDNLSCRDESAFKNLFEQLGSKGNVKIADMIRYGTFEDLSEHLIFEMHGDVRLQVQDALLGKKKAAFSAVRHRRALLIDEVDVFLKSDFLGGSYRPALPLSDPKIADLMKAVWSNPSADPLQLPEFQAILPSDPQAGGNVGQATRRRTKATVPAGFLASGYEWLAKSAAREMQRAAQDFQKAPQKRGVDYELFNKDGSMWVHYKQHDAYWPTSRLNYAYQTNCVYLYENQRGSISDDELKDHGLHMHVSCGEFAYAMLPTTKDYAPPAVPAFYEFILGVTGTLHKDRLPPEARELLEEEIGIQHMTYCPSMYGELKREWNPASADCVKMASSASEHFLTITDEIKRRLQPTSKQYQGKRAVLVFFESNEVLESFYNSSYFKSMKDAANRLTEASARDEEDRDSLISKATRQGQVTLATRVFGRGIDFVVDDEHMVTCGGLHVLCTFFPREKSEEVQIRGRCGRQGEAGSFSMVLSGPQLDDFAGDNATMDDLKGWVSSNELYAKMSSLRDRQAQADKEERLKQAEEAKKKHLAVAEALHLASSVRSGDALPNLLKRYNVTASATSCRTLFLIDITWSMDALIEKTKNCIGSFFDRCARVLVEEGIDAGFELQIAGYSNYNVSAEELVERSTWEAKPHNLAMFLQNLKTRGGWGPEAVEAGLMHALQEHKKRPLSQIILIGDAPPNPISGGETIAEKRRRGYHGEQYWVAQKPAWSEAGIPIKDAKGMLADLQAVAPVPLHAYYIQSRAEVGFRELAALSVGEAHRLDVNSKDGAQLLTDAVCKQILSSLGGKSLTDAYERMKPSFN